MDSSFIMIFEFVFIFLLSTLNSGETISAKCAKGIKVTNANVPPYELYKTDCCNENLNVYKPFPDGKYPDKPKTFQLTNFLRNTKKGIKAVWNANVTHLKGFKIQYVFNDTGVIICRILDFSEFLTNKSVDNLDFEFELYPVRKNKIFMVQLYSLPESGNNYLAAQQVDTFFCREWTSLIYYEVKENSLFIHFEQGPSTCNIKKYKVTIFHLNTTPLNEELLNSSKTTSELTHEFRNMCPGKYYITVEIFDEDPFVNCICTNAKQKCGEGCFRTRSRNFTIFGSSCLKVTATTITTTSSFKEAPKTPSTLTIFLAVVGAMVGLLLLGLTFYCLKRTVQEKRGLLFCTEDHPYHLEAIDQFVSFMNKSKCKVEVAAHLVKGSDSLRLSLEIQKSDFVILVYSKALHKRIQAWKSNQDYINFFKEDNSALLTPSLFKELKASNKLIICNFPQVSNDSVSSEFPSVKCYTLINELNLLIQQIHGTGVDQELAIFVKSHKLNNNFNNLSNTIKSAVNFEESNSNWFEDKYFCPKKMDSLNEISDYTENISDGCEHSIYSVPVSYLMEQINERNNSSV